MSATRKIKRILERKATIEGAGVHLKRVFGYNEVPMFDPFLLLDDFGSANPADYIAGFPWHPHRGIETITYMLEGIVEHGDSLGNKGVIRSGDIQWMTAGSGIIHQEMPQAYDGAMRGFQLWLNLPAAKKMMKPRYRDVTKEKVVEVSQAGGTRIKIISGEVDGVKGPVRDIVVDQEYLDVSLGSEGRFTRKTKKGHTVFAYVIAGSGWLEPSRKQRVADGEIVLFGDGDSVDIAASADGLRFLFVAGEPLGEPVAWYGPIVMNTDEEIQLAFREYQDGTFIKTDRV
jgi:redox-sensitive bicupin YhaK (pirin superfamily)